MRDLCPASLPCCQSLSSTAPPPLRCYVANCTTAQECRRESLISDCPREYQACLTTIDQKGRIIVLSIRLTDCVTLKRDRESITIYSRVRPSRAFYDSLFSWQSRTGYMKYQLTVWYVRVYNISPERNSLSSSLWEMTGVWSNITIQPREQ